MKNLGIIVYKSLDEIYDMEINGFYSIGDQIMNNMDLDMFYELTRLYNGWVTTKLNIIDLVRDKMGPEEDVDPLIEKIIIG